jgi:hypothetical protein
VITGPRVRGLVLVAFLLALLAGCQGDDDPRSELERALETTASESFRYQVTAEADRAALEQLGGDALETAAFLDGAGVAGGRDPDGWFQVGLSIGGDVPLLEVIVPGDDRLFLRTGLGDLLGLGARDPSEQLDPALEELGVDPESRRALTISFRGGWIALTDVSSLRELVDASEASTPAEPAATPPADLEGLLDAVTILGVEDVGEVRRFEVEVATAPLLALLGIDGEERTVPGTVDVRDGRLLEARLVLSGGDLAAAAGPVRSGEAAAAEDDGADGAVEVVLRVGEPDRDGDVVERPEPGASVTSRQLFTLVEQLQSATGGPLP